MVSKIPVEEALAKRRQGYTVRELAEEYNCSRSLITKKAPFEPTEDFMKYRIARRVREAGLPQKESE